MTMTRDNGTDAFHGPDEGHLRRVQGALTDGKRQHLKLLQARSRKIREKRERHRRLWERAAFLFCSLREKPGQDWTHMT